MSEGSAMNQINGTDISYIFIDAEYDYDNLENPIHYRINYGNFALIDSYYTTHYIHHLSPNIAYKADNTTSVFYDVEDIKKFSFYSYENFLLVLVFEISDRYDIYIPYIDYQPVMNTSRRNLESNSEENIMSTPYFIFYFLSQIGGIWSFFILIIGPILKYIKEVSLMQKILNEYNNILANENLQVNKPLALNTSNKQSRRNNYFSQNRSFNEQEQNEGGSSSEHDYGKDDNEIQHNSSQNNNYQNYRSSNNRNNLNYENQRSISRNDERHQRKRHKRRQKHTDNNYSYNMPDDNDSEIIMYEAKDALYNIL